MKWALLALLLAGCDKLFLQENPLALDAPEGPTACAPEFAGSRYVWFMRSTSWLEAEATCRSLQGVATHSHLAVIGDAAEALMVGALVTGADPWVGLTTLGVPKDQFHWITRDPAGIPWLTGQPDDPRRATGNCGRLVDSGAGLADSDCAEMRDVLCECDGFPVDESRF